METAFTKAPTSFHLFLSESPGVGDESLAQERYVGSFGTVESAREEARRRLTAMETLQRSVMVCEIAQQREDGSLEWLALAAREITPE